MPIHLELLSLVGYEDEGRDMVPAKELNARKRAMMSGLHSLRKTTGQTSDMMRQHGGNS